MAQIKIKDFMNKLIIYKSNTVRKLTTKFVDYTIVGQVNSKINTFPNQIFNDSFFFSVNDGSGYVDINVFSPVAHWFIDTFKQNDFISLRGFTILVEYPAYFNGFGFEIQINMHTYIEKIKPIVPFSHFNQFRDNLACEKAFYLSYDYNMRVKGSITEIANIVYFSFQGWNCLLMIK